MQLLRYLHGSYGMRGIESGTKASFLFRAITDLDKNYNIDGNPLGTPLNQLPQTYFTFKPNMLSPPGGSGIAVGGCSNSTKKPRVKVGSWLGMSFHF